MQKSLRRSHTWGKLAEFLNQRLFGNFLLLAAIPLHLGFLHNGDVMYQNKDKCAYDKAPNFGTSDKIVCSLPNFIQTDSPNSDKQASEKPSEEKITIVDENLQPMISLVMSMSKSLKAL
ncbi:uncharacterized protein LOC132606417 [Lycium barbarum]|uniref:uncharacterized protein LOC132606417 n=1 Tax=Lycium barbarum TaxID=112863 RepID=UPI00293F3C98|nr:uncharacterized protein LOC132606417 [Lycium barbarum]